MNPPSNPSAFPVPELRDQFGCGIREGEAGMSLRDWFAGQAPIDDKMAAYAMGCDDGIDLTNDADRKVLCAVWAGMRYEYADAMLSARSVRSEADV